MEKQELMVHEENLPMTAIEIRAQVNRIQEVMKAVMKDKEHYGVIPGTGNKKTLFKAGAEKLMMTFRISPDPEVEDLSVPDEIRYRIKVRMMSFSGIYLGSGVGECSTMEEKYMWRKAVCDQEFVETESDRRRAKWSKGQNGHYQIKQVRTNPADLANTVLKMAKKRALIDGTLTVLGASDIFAQDFEDIPEEVRGSIAGQKGDQKTEIKQPQRKTSSANNGGQAKSTDSSEFITQPQIKRLYAISHQSTKTIEDIKTHFKLESLGKLKRSDVDAAVTILEANPLEKEPGSDG